MRKHLTPAETIDEGIERRPVFAPILRALEPLFTARKEAADSLTAQAKERGLVIPAISPDLFEKGIPLLAGASLEGAAALLESAAKTVLPKAEALQNVGCSVAAVQKFFASAGTGDKDQRETFAAALLAGMDEPVVAAAQSIAVEPAVLKFLGEFVLGAVLRAMVQASKPEEGMAPWEETTYWGKGNCPVCGSFPILSWFDRERIDVHNGAYLRDGGGRIFLHCGQCGADWRYRRGHCPGCGTNETGATNTLKDAEATGGEQLFWCGKCKAYYPNIDLRSRDTDPDLDTEALCLMYLDIVAKERKLTPLHPSFWNA